MCKKVSDFSFSRIDFLSFLFLLNNLIIPSLMPIYSSEFCREIKHFRRKFWALKSVPPGNLNFSAALSILSVTILISSFKIKQDYAILKLFWDLLFFDMDEL